MEAKKAAEFAAAMMMIDSLATVPTITCTRADTFPKFRQGMPSAVSEGDFNGFHVPCVYVEQLTANLIIGGFSDARGMEIGDSARREQTRWNPEAGV